MPDATTEVLIGAGSNLGDRHGHMAHALRRLSGLPGTRLRGVSTLYETAPVGGPDNQGPYLNAAIGVSTALSSRDLLSALREIEGERGRERAVRWGARTLDLDLLIFGDELSDDPELTLPHPRMHERRFVMVPVCDIAALRTHPRLGRTMASLLADLPVAPGDLTAADTGWAAVPAAAGGARG